MFRLVRNGNIVHSKMPCPAVCRKLIHHYAPLITGSTSCIRTLYQNTFRSKKIHAILGNYLIQSTFHQGSMSSNAVCLL